MTKREFFEAVIENVQVEELANFAREEIAKMDARNARRSSKPSKKQEENEKVKARILEVLSNEPQSASEVGRQVAVSTQKASALLRQIEGLEVSELKIKGKGKVKGYALPSDEEEEEEE